MWFCCPTTLLDLFYIHDPRHGAEARRGISAVCFWCVGFVVFAFGVQVRCFSVSAHRKSYNSRFSRDIIVKYQIYIVPVWKKRDRFRQNVNLHLSSGAVMDQGRGPYLIHGEAMWQPLTIIKMSNFAQWYSVHWWIKVANTTISAVSMAIFPSWFISFFA